jgi:hypothetical protein
MATDSLEIHQDRARGRSAVGALFLSKAEGDRFEARWDLCLTAGLRLGPIDLTHRELDTTEAKHRSERCPWPSPEPQAIERWTAQRKAAIILEVLKGQISVPEVARTASRRTSTARGPKNTIAPASTR